MVIAEDVLNFYHTEGTFKSSLCMYFKQRMLNMIYSEFEEVMTEIRKQVSKGKMFFSSYGIGELDLLPEELDKCINKETTSDVNFYVHRDKNNKECYIVVCRFPSSKELDVWVYIVDNSKMMYLDVVPVVNSEDIVDFDRFEESVLNATPIKAFQWVFDN